MKINKKNCILKFHVGVTKIVVPCNEMILYYYNYKEDNYTEKQCYCFSKCMHRNNHLVDVKSR